MSKYKLKVPLNSINIKTWEYVLNELYNVRESTYVVDVNESNTFSWYYRGNFIKAIKAVQKSSHYSVDDEYVLINVNTNNIVSGDGDYILEKLEKNMEKYISTLIYYLNNNAIFYSYWMRPIIEEG